MVAGYGGRLMVQVPEVFGEVPVWAVAARRRRAPDAGRR
jgi:hypothetical protein